MKGSSPKRADAKYVGSRGGSWLKTKCTRRQEFVVVGWTTSDKGRGFRSLILGVNEGGELRYAGKVGTGFDNAEIMRLGEIMEPLAVKKPTVSAPRAEVRGANWIRPKLVAEIAFTEMTTEGTLRHPSYLGLREDKKPEAVVVEKEAPAVEAAASTPSSIKISNPDRVIDPDGGTTKGQLADHYRAVAPIMLPWAGSRPISLVRCPQGRSKKCFFQKHDAGMFGDKVHQVAISEKDGHEEPYLYLDGRRPADLRADGNDRVPWLGCADRGCGEGRPARVRPRSRRGAYLRGSAVGRLPLSEYSQADRLETFPMVTGGKGVHVIAPLTPRAEWPEAKSFAHRLAQAVAKVDPKNFTSALPKVQRKGRIFVDYLRNQRGATAVMPYSVRARAGAPVAVPISWKEMETIDTPAHWHVGDAKDMLKRASSKALAGWGRVDQTLPDL